LGITRQKPLLKIIIKSCENKLNETEKQAGKKEKGLGEGIFVRLPVSRKQTMGRERFRNSSVKRKAKQRNFLSLN